MASEIFDSKLPSLRGSRQSKSILGEGEDQMSKAIQELSDSLILLQNNVKTPQQLSKELADLKSGFIDASSLNNDNLESSMSGMLKALMELRSQNESFLETNIEANKYLSKADKRDAAAAIREASSAAQLKSIHREFENQTIDSQFFIKTMSAVRNSLEDAKDLDKTTRKALLTEVDNMGLRFHESGEVNNAAIFDVVDRVSNLKDSEGNKAATIDSQAKVIEAVTQRVMKNVVMSAKESGDQDLTKASLSAAQLQDHMGPILKDMDEQSRLHIGKLTESFGESQISLKEYSRGVEKVLQDSNKLNAESTKQLSRLEAHLNVISEHTDPTTNKLTNAEKILQQDQMALERENNEKLQGLLESIDTKENMAVRKSALEGVSSAEDAGEAAIDAAWDFFSGEGGGRRRRGGKPRRGGKGFGRGGLRGATSAAGALMGQGSGVAGAAKSFGGTALKAAGPLAAVASTGMAAYDFATADNTADRKSAVGSGVGGLIGGAIGVLGGPVGVMAGAALGNWVGGKVGKWFSKPQDTIPDEVKDGGPQAELNYINDLLEPGVRASIQSGSGDYSEKDLKDLLKYKKKLQSKVPAGTTAQSDPEIDSLVEQGLTDPAQISIATGKPLAEVRQGMARKESGQFEPTSGNVDLGPSNSGNKNSSDSVVPTTVIQTGGSDGGGGGQRPDRISDESLNLLAHMV